MLGQPLLQGAQLLLAVPQRILHLLHQLLLQLVAGPALLRGRAHLVDVAGLGSYRQISLFNVFAKIKMRHKNLV